MHLVPLVLFRSRYVMHVNTIFKRMVDAIRDVIDDRDYEMKDVLDYLNYCYKDKPLLFQINEAYAGLTYWTIFDFIIKTAFL